MTDEKEFGFSEEGSGERSSSPRARNRTVMLSPEMTGAVRARIAQGLGQAPQNQVVFGGADQLGPLVNRVPSAPSPLNQVPHQSQVIHPGYRPEGLETNPYQNVASVAPSVPGEHSDVPQAQPQFNGRGFARYQRLTPVVGFLVSYDSNPDGEVFELRSGRLIITSDYSALGSIMYVSNPTISPSHAILRITGEGEIQVLDQLSEFGTRVELRSTGETVELSGDKSPVGHGDVLQFGERRFHVCLVVRGGSE